MFMRPVVISCHYAEIEMTSGGSFILEVDIAGVDPKVGMVDVTGQLRRHLDDYIPYDMYPGKIEEIEVRSGVIWRLSAPGSLDCTEWCAAPTVKEALAEIEDMYNIKWCESCDEWVDYGDSDCCPNCE